MKEIEGDLWYFHSQGKWVGITTNGDVNKYGQAVMGRGVALQAAKKFTSLSVMLGDKLKRWGNHPYLFLQNHLITIPVKVHWHEEAQPPLIWTSLERLVTIATAMDLKEFYLPRPGCGNGGLRWEGVKGLISGLLDDRFTIVQIPEPEKE